ncbi:MAG: CBS domain-containing protein, partial [Gammaproteobacteria bacterium]
MAATYLPLKPVALAIGTRIPETQSAKRQLSAESPAVDSMTDLTIVPAASIDAKRTIDDANNLMLVRGVRMLFVLTPELELAGLITANDVMGEKPMRIVRANRVLHKDVLVEDVMTPAENLEVLEYADVKQASVGNIVVTLRNAGRQHALVVARSANGPYI